MRSFALLLRCEMNDLIVWNTRDEGEADALGENLKLNDPAVTQAIAALGDPGPFRNVTKVEFLSGRVVATRIVKEFGVL